MAALTLFSLLTLVCTTLVSASQQTCALSTPQNIAPGTLTVEQGCTHYHEVVKGDSCYSILKYYPDALSLKAFYAANPSVDSKCFNLRPGTSVCVSGPVNVAPGSLTLDTGCTKFRKVVKGDTCDSIVKSIGDISLADFYRFNSKVDSKCSNLPLNSQVCTCDGGKGSTPGDDDDDCEEEEHPTPTSSMPRPPASSSGPSSQPSSTSAPPPSSSASPPEPSQPIVTFQTIKGRWEISTASYAQPIVADLQGCENACRLEIATNNCNAYLYYQNEFSATGFVCRLVANQQTLVVSDNESYGSYGRIGSCAADGTTTPPFPREYANGGRIIPCVNSPALPPAPTVTLRKRHHRRGVIRSDSSGVEVVGELMYNLEV